MNKLVLGLQLRFHQRLRISITGNIAHRQVNAFFNDQLVIADIGHHQPVPVLLHRIGTLVLALDGIEQDIVRLFRKGQERQLGIVEEVVDEMELDQHLLTQQLRAIEEDLVILEIVDVLYLEGRHPDLCQARSEGLPRLARDHRRRKH